MRDGLAVERPPRSGALIETHLEIFQIFAFWQGVDDRREAFFGEMKPIRSAISSR